MKPLALRPVAAPALAVLALCAAGAACGAEMKTVQADAMQWGDAPPSLPRGAKLAVLFGDPGKPGPFAVRLSMPGGAYTKAPTIVQINGEGPFDIQYLRPEDNSDKSPKP